MKEEGNTSAIFVVMTPSC